MPIDTNYPRVDGELKATRARVAEVAEAMKARSEQPAPTHVSSLTNAQPVTNREPRVSTIAHATRPAATEPREAATASPPPMPATRNVSLPANSPRPAEAADKPTPVNAPELPKPRAAALPSVVPQVAAPSLPERTPAPVASGGSQPIQQGAMHEEYDGHADLVARILWRDGPSTRR